MILGIGRHISMLPVHPVGRGVAVWREIQDAAVVAVSHKHPTAAVLGQPNWEHEAVGVMTAGIGGKVGLPIDPGGGRPGLLRGGRRYEKQDDRDNEQDA